MIINKIKILQVKSDSGKYLYKKKKNRFQQRLLQH